MLNYFIKRVLWMIPQLFLISVLAFIIIQLPPGDVLEVYLDLMRSTGHRIDESLVRAWRRGLGLDKPLHMQYLMWIQNIIFRFDFGYSFHWMRPVDEVIVDKMGPTIAIALGAALFTYGVGIPIGILVSVKPYSLVDYFFTVLSFIGLAVPPFVLTLVLMSLAFSKFGIKVGGLFSPEYQVQGWSWAKFVDMLKHLWLPVILVGMGGVPVMIRTLRATMLDELRRPYVMVARAKGLSELKLLLRYPLRLAINPILSGVMWLLPWLFSGGVLVEIVLNLDTAGPELIRAIRWHDMYEVSSYILIIGALTAVAGLLSDLLLAAVDPRIRLGHAERG